MAIKGTVAACAWLAIAGAAARATPPLAAFGHLPSVDLVAVSPDGSKAAMVVGDAAERQLQIRRVADRTLVFVTPVGTTKLRALQWAGENHVIVTRSATAEISGLTGPKREWELAIDFNLATRKAAPILTSGADDTVAKMNVIAGAPMPRIVGGRPMVYVSGITFPGESGVLTLFEVDLEKRRTRQVEVGNPNTGEFLVDASGRLAARVDYYERTRPLGAVHRARTASGQIDGGYASARFALARRVRPHRRQRADRPV